jgi:signal transduction histidine kinase
VNGRVSAAALGRDAARRPRRRPDRHLRFLAALLLGLAALSCRVAAPASLQDVVRIEKARLVESGNAGQTLDLQLPHQVIRPRRGFARFRVEAEFTIAGKVDAQLWAIYFISMYDGGQVSVNGIEVGNVATSTPATTERHVRPFMFQIPAAVLRTGVNRVEVQLSTSETLILVSRIFVGPEDLVREDFEHRLFWQNTMAQIAFVYAIAGAGVLLGIYSLRRNQVNYLLMGLVAIGWGIMSFVYVLPAMPAPLYPYWRLLHIVSIGMITNCSWIFLMHESDPENRWFPRLCIFWTVLGPAVYLINFWINDVSFFRAFEGAWELVAGVLGVYSLVQLLRSIVNQPTWRRVIFFASTGFAVAAGLADITLLMSASSAFGGVGYILPAVSPLWFTAIGLVLVFDFAASLAEQDRHEAMLTQRLAEQQSELARLYESDRRLAREHAANEERQRIVQEMHDGLGSQLVSSLALSERGVLSAAQVSDLLRECIDDLRLAIDAMSEGEDQLPVAVGNLRFRMAPRLRAAGIALRWDVSGLTDTAAVPLNQVLPVLRILQEAITNALKHSAATLIDVSMSANRARVRIRVSDNGRGFDPATIRHGKGMGGMQKRARDLGAELSITSHQGTTVSVVLPLQGGPDALAA